MPKSSNLSEELKIFLASIEPPYNIMKFNKLGFKLDAKFLDPITTNPMNFPVILYGKNFDFHTLNALDSKEDGTRLNPFDRKPFTLADIKPNREIDREIKALITAEILRRNLIVHDICETAKAGEVDKLKKLYADNKEININDLLDSGEGALHYACKAVQLDCAKYLVEEGADLDTLHNSGIVVPEELKKHLIKFLKPQLKSCYVACLRYANLLLSGLTVKSDAVRALELFKQAGDLCDPIGYLKYGEIYAKGLGGIKKNLPKAKKYYKLAADQGLSDAQSLYAECCFNGYGIEKNLLQAAVYYKLAADQGLSDAQLGYAGCCFNGHGIEINIIEAAKYYKLAADQGLVYAQLGYAGCCFNGHGIEQNLPEAAKYYKLASDKGLADAQNGYAACCFNGYGIKENLTEAAKCYKLAADQGLTDAQHLYATCCFYGHGIEINRIEAVKYYKIAADQGLETSQFLYAACCYNGYGIEINIIEAVKYYKLSADQGLAQAQYDYAKCCTHGDGIEKNLPEAVKYYKLAADQGLAGAQYLYAGFCFDGYGIEKNLPEAAKYSKLAADQGLQPTIQEVAAYSRPLW